jgi:uncharacterized membrane protein HdeD (DUF308 family)
MPEDPPRYQWVDDDDTDEPTRPVRRSGIAVAAVVLGVLSIPLALTVYLGAVCGVLALVLGLIGVFQTRQGRATGRGLAVAGLVTGLVGVVLAGSLGVYGMRTYRDCQAKLGHAPSSDELRDCVRSGR